MTLPLGPVADGGSRHYFKRVGAQEFIASPLVQGAWNLSEQHIAPSLGLIAHAIEADLKARRADELVLGRLSYDILGTIPIGTVTIEVKVLRPGRTIELVEARMLYDQRPVVLARAWLMRGFDTGALAQASYAPLPPPEMLPQWDMRSEWGGACIGTLEVFRRQLEPGRAQAWLRTDVALIDSEPVSATARMLGLADIANGITMLMSPTTAAFPNLDLTAHIFRAVRGARLGLDTSVSIGPGGIGLTHSVLYDEDGAFGTLGQCLTVRPQVHIG